MATKPDGTLLVEVTVEEYNLLWDHMLNGHSEATTTPKAHVLRRASNLDELAHAGLGHVGWTRSSRRVHLT